MAPSEKRRHGEIEQRFRRAASEGSSNSTVHICRDLELGRYVKTTRSVEAGEVLMAGDVCAPASAVRVRAVWA